MSADLTDGQRRRRDAVIAFARKELGGDVEQDDADARFPRGDWDRCARFGVLGWPVPTAYGGGGLDPLSTIVALEALGYGCRDNGLVFAVNNHLWGCAVYLVEHGTEEQKRRWLPPLARGELIGAHALSEPGCGSDILAMATTARRDGDDWVLTGTKCFVSNAPVADLFVTFARTSGAPGEQAGLSAFLVPADRPGLTRGRPVTKMGLRTTPMGAVELDGCRVPASHLIGREGAGYAVFTSTIEWERSFMFAAHVGAMERILDTCLAHATTRRQFDRPIGSFQAVGHRIADMRIRLELARLILHHVGRLKAEGRLALLEATIAKVFISESLVTTARDAVEIHGARGYLADAGVERELRDALGGPIYAGTSAVQRGVLAELLGLRGCLSGARS